MKRMIIVFLSVLLSLSITMSAMAAQFSSLGQLQKYLEKHSPAELSASGPHYVETEGVILELHWCGKNNHYQMTLQVDDPSAVAPIGAEHPQLIVHFRLHKEAPPFKIGDMVTVFGSLNELYSSVMVPWVLAKSINGTDDF